MTFTIPEPRHLWRSLRDWAFANRIDLLMLLGVTILAAIPRLTMIGSIPEGFQGDEAVAGLEARSILDGDGLNIEGYGVYSREALGVPAGTFYWTAGVLAVIGDTTMTVRIAYALLGIATVSFTYLAFRSMFGRTVAVVASVLLAVSAWHLHYSRIALIPLGWPLMEMATLWCLFMAVRRDSRWWYAFAGAAFAGGVYTYQGYSIFAAAMVPALVAIGLLSYRRKPAKFAQGMAAMLAASLIVGLPMASFAWHHPEIYKSRYETYSVTRTEAYRNADSVFEKADVLIDRELDYVRSVITRPVPDGLDAAGVFPMIDRATLGLLIAGGGILLWRARKAPYAVLLVLVLGIGVGPTLAEEGWYRRTLGIVPLLMGVAALPLALVWDEGRKRGLVATAVAGAVVIAVMGGVAGINLGRYFGTYDDSPPAKHVFNADYTEAIEYMADLPDGSHVLLYSERFPINYETRRFVAPDVSGENRSLEFGGDGSLSGGEDRSRDLAYIFLGGYVGELDEVEDLYPGGRSSQVRDGDTVTLAAYFLPKVEGSVPPEPTPGGPTVQPTPLVGAEERDRQRIADLEQIEAALAAYRAEHGSYPENRESIQSLCRFQELDAGCDLQEFLDPVPADPSNDPQNGYYYASDGSSYAVYAIRESDEVEECPSIPAHLSSLGSVVCALGP